MGSICMLMFFQVLRVCYKNQFTVIICSPLSENPLYSPCSTNLIVQTLPFGWCLLDIVLRIKWYKSFRVTLQFHLKKHFLKFTKLVKIMETKTNKIVQNVKTKWISVPKNNSKMLAKYQVFLMKMATDKQKNSHV